MKLILVVGPSGVGKDTLLRSARKRFGASAELNFVRRYITRPPDGNEDNYYVDSTCFSLLKRSSFFVSDWQAHGNMYGVPRHALVNGNDRQKLLCSISRSAIGDFEQAHDDVTVLQVSASLDLLRERLLSRGRESEADVEKRLLRAVQPVAAKDLVTFDNSSTLEQAQSDFIQLLERL